MPHNIGQMFYYGKMPWHELGNEVEDPATAKVALEKGGLDWEVELVDIQTAEKIPTEITRRRAVVRTDKNPGDPDRFLGVVHPGFRPLQNHEGLNILEALLGEGQAIYHTGGYLGKGEVVWVLAKLPGEMTIRGRDIVDPYLLFSNSHDGTRAIDLRLTTVRVVCQNTLNLALSDKKNEFILKQSHSVRYSQVRQQAEDFFRFIRKEILVVEKGFQLLANTSLTQDGFDQFLSAVYPYPKEPASTTRATMWKNFETRMESIKRVRSGVGKVYFSGRHNEDTPDPTLWGALNAVTAYVDHEQDLPDAERYSYVMFGEGTRVKELAYKKALEVAEK